MMELDCKIPDVEKVGSIFVGDALTFSDTALRLVEAELPCISCDRMSNVNDLLLMGTFRSDTVRLIIVDEWMAEALIKILPQLRILFPTASIALAYRHLEIARAIMEQMQVNPSWGQVSFLPMDLNVDSWLSVIRLLASGACYFPPQLFASGLPVATHELQGTQQAENANGVQLTAREMEVLEFAAAGKQNKIIADELKLSQHTVKLHMHHIIAKLGVHNRTEAANWFHGRYIQHRGD